MVSWSFANSKDNFSELSFGCSGLFPSPRRGCGDGSRNHSLSLPHSPRSASSRKKDLLYSRQHPIRTSSAAAKHTSCSQSPLCIRSASAIRTASAFVPHPHAKCNAFKMFGPVSNCSHICCYQLSRSYCKN